MSVLTDRTDLESLLAFDEIIDVRTPAEFAEDHMPGAINLPVLSNAQRAEVGEIYVQVSRQKARRIGAAHVARNIAAHLEGPLADKPGSYAPLIYCWRGGQRSDAMATVLAQVGWRPTRLAGGYKTYRRRVTASLYGDRPGPRLILISGPTGTAKTEILGRLSGAGVQAVDLEGLAGHRGSLFGAIPGHPQPSQKRFESHLLRELERLDPARPAVVEGESSRIGEINLPPVLWRAMSVAPRIEITAPLPARTSYLLTAYDDLLADRAALIAALEALPGRHGAKRLAEWRERVLKGDFEALVRALVELHYDPAYERSRRKDERPALASIDLGDLSADAQTAAAGRIADIIRATEKTP